MKTNQPTFKLLLILLMGLSLSSCEDDDSKVTPTLPAPGTPVAPGIVQVEFNQPVISIAENDGPKEILINLDKAANKHGILTINLTAENTNTFTTIPSAVDNKINLTVEPGQSVVKFSFNPTDNNLLNESQSIEFTITTVSDGFAIGEKEALSLTLVDNESPAALDFSTEFSSADENSSAAKVALSLSHSSPGNGFVTISIESPGANYGTDYVTEPAAIDGEINLPVEAGVETIEFTITPTNNYLINGDWSLNLTIISTEGSVTAGQVLNHALKIKDDELFGKAKGYITGGGGWSFKKTYEYNEQGKISKVVWEQGAPGNHISGTHTYEYDALGNVVKMISSDFTETIYTWENGQIVKEETFDDDGLKKFILYGYDNAGNVGESAIHYRQPNGELKLSMVIVFLYREDGNIYKQMNYSPIEGSEEYSLLSTKTFEEYSTIDNPFTMVDILPNKKTQPNLPLSYRLEEGGHNFYYQLTYQLNEAGQPIKRTATSSIGTDVSVFEYY